VYGFPLRRAARIAISTLRDLRQDYRDIERLRMVAFGDDAFAAYADEVREYLD
jgi:O-acetyl-ADP-ribose deacetylase (regulator of RNase III)